MTMEDAIGKFLKIVVAAASAILFFNLAHAQTYPTRVIKMVVPFAPGGQPDAIARLIARHFSAKVGTTIIDNRPGASGLIAIRAATSAEPDGHTILFASTTTLAILPALSRSADFDPVKSFVPIGMISSAPFILTVGPSVPAKTVQEFVAYAKAHPGKLNFAAPTGGPPHLGGELFKAATGIDIVPVSVPPMNQAFTDLIGGQMDVIFDAPALPLPLIREGKIRALVAMSAKRTPDLPDVPTMAEAGLGDVEVTVWNGLRCAGWDAAGGGRAPQRRAQRGAQVAGGDNGAPQLRLAAGFRLTGGFRALRRDGSKEMGRCGAARRRED